ncbi:MAG TPA: phosphatase PAP2 family protein [Solirubrobacterales bacterium]|nr:phosphatase PAP2 family protein [Solirubrobacterales bacterium]
MTRRVKAPLFAAIACAAAIAPLAALAYSYGPVKTRDLDILMRLERETGHLHGLATVLVNLGDLASLLILGAVVAGIGLWFGRRREVVAALILIAGANVTTQALKSLLEHVRYTAAQQGWEMPWANSFPSGHTTAAATLAVGLLFVVPARHRLAAAVAGFLLTAAVGISVMVLSWHYPSDVLGALLVVGAWAFAILAALRYRDDRADRETAVSGPGRRPRGRWAVSTE